MTFKLRSPAFGPGGEIPLKYTGDGADISPPLRWTDPPEGTKSFALTVDEPRRPLRNLGPFAETSVGAGFHVACFAERAGLTPELLSFG